MILCHDCRNADQEVKRLFWMMFRWLLFRWWLCKDVVSMHRCFRLNNKPDGNLSLSCNLKGGNKRVMYLASDKWIETWQNDFCFGVLAMVRLVRNAESDERIPWGLFFYLAIQDDDRNTVQDHYHGIRKHSITLYVLRYFKVLYYRKQIWENQKKWRKEP